MKKYFTTFLFLLIGLIGFSQTGNVGIGNTTPVAKLDVAGDLALREGAAIAVSGANPAVVVSLHATNAENSFYRITGTPTGIMTLSSIANGVDGQIIALVNATSIKLKITNNNTANGILTAGALTQVISPNGSITLQFSTTAARWFVTNASGSSLTDWIKATALDEPAISTDNQYVTGNVGVGGHANGLDKAYDFATNAPLTPLVVVSPGAATAASSPVATGLRLAQPGTNGTKWPLSTDFKLGSYAVTGANAQSQLDIALGNGATSTPDVTIMSLLGNGKVGIGNLIPDAPLTIGDGSNSNAYMHIKRNTNPHINLFEGGTPVSVARIQGHIVSTHPQFQITSADGATSKFNVNQDDGYVGIGTTSPLRKLEVNDAMKFTNSSSDANDGVIGTAPFAAGLNIVGINTDATYRKINMWGGITQNQNDLGNYFLNNNYFQGTGNIYIGNPSATSNPYLLPRNPIGGSNPTYLRIGSSSNPMQDLYSNNAYISRVTIGSTGATTYPLRVDASINGLASYNYYYYMGPGCSNGSTTTTPSNVAIFSSGRIVIAGGGGCGTGELDVVSDKRIKNIISVSDKTKDLESLNKIEITNYSMKEDLTSNPHVYKKVIAQQVQSIYPTAVRVEDKPFYVPNIFTKSVSYNINNNILTITLDKVVKTDQDVSINKNIKCLAFENESKNKIEILGKIIDIKDNTIEIELSSEEYKNKDLTKELFVYGTEVNDFLSVDYEAISMLNVSATQELYKKITALEKENSDLKMQTQTTTKDVSQLKAQLEDSTNKNEKDVAELKIQIEALKTLILNTGLKSEK